MYTSHVYTINLAFEQLGFMHGRTHDVTCHNSTDSVPTSNLVCIKEITIRTTFCIAGIIYFTCILVTDSVNVTVTKMPSTNIFNELCVKIRLLRSTPKKLLQYVLRSTSGYASTDAYSTISYSRGIRWLPSPALSAAR